MLLVALLADVVVGGTPPPLSCTAWATGQCLSKADGRVGQLLNVSTPQACCAACNREARCRAWALYGAKQAGKPTYCDLYASDEPDRFECKQGISSLSSHRPVPPPPQPQP